MNDPLDDRLDALVRDLRPIEPPPELVARAQAAMVQEVRESRRRRPSRFAGVALLLAAAVALVVVLPGAPEPESKGPMVERGSGLSLPEVGLKLFQVRGDRVERFSRSTLYRPGDVLRFRASAQGGTSAVLLRVDASGAAEVLRQELSAGETNLAKDWRIDAGETSGVFVLVNGPLDATTVESVRASLEGVYDPNDTDAVCAAVLPSGLRCVAERVNVEVP